MLRSLHETQAAVAAHLAGDVRPELMALIAGEPHTALQRLQLHRHHIATSLGAALAVTFATVAAVVGPTFFERLARDFIAGTSPRNPVLSRYGERFPEFVAATQQMHGLPYLADVARLDWALNVAFHSPLEPRLSAAELAALPEESLPDLSVRLPVGASLIKSAWPLDLIWQASQPGASVDKVDLAAGSTALVIFRRAEDAAFAVLTSLEAVFVQGFSQGGTLAVAARHAAQFAGDFDLAATFGRLLGLGLLAARMTTRPAGARLQAPP